jgi:hypothetical protein
MSDRDLNFEIQNSLDLTKMLTGLLMDLRRGNVSHESAKSITLVADKLNKHNVNTLNYKKMTKHKTPIDFFEK